MFTLNSHDKNSLLFDFFMDNEKKYTNGEITVVWKPELCIHAANCWKELCEVFDPKKRPWVNTGGADTERIIQQVNRCPSGALSYYFNNKKEKKGMEQTGNNNGTTIEIMENGPLIVKSLIYVKNNGNENKHEKGAAFCRCGKSGNEPYCDGSHMKNPFE